MNRRTLIRGLGASIGLGAVAGGAAVLRRREAVRRESDRIIGPWPELGINANWLLPGLRGAHMAVVDRPHRGSEASDLDHLRKIRRIRTFEVNSSDRRLRQPDTRGAGLKILCVGDSVTFGWGVADDETWPVRLAERLGARGAEPLVYNAGVPGQPLAPMRNYLAKMAPADPPDIVLVARRMPPQELPVPKGYVQLFSEAARALPKARLGLILPPVATFDPHGQRQWTVEQATLRRTLPALPILELTPRFAAAQKGKPGVRLELAGDKHRVVDNESGALLLETPAPPQEMDERVYALFEEDPDLYEPYFFDTGHPDAAGMELFADHVAAWLEELGWLA